MSSTIICDVCGREIQPTIIGNNKKINVEPTTGSITRSFDLHDHCYSAFIRWMADCREKSARFKDVKTTSKRALKELS